MSAPLIDDWFTMAADTICLVIGAKGPDAIVVFAA
jgi:hypothetical protein